MLPYKVHAYHGMKFLQNTFLGSMHADADTTPSPQKKKKFFFDWALIAIVTKIDSSRTVDLMTAVYPVSSSLTNQTFTWKAWGHIMRRFSKCPLHGVALTAGGINVLHI